MADPKGGDGKAAAKPRAARKPRAAVAAAPAAKTRKAAAKPAAAAAAKPAAARPARAKPQPVATIKGKTFLDRVVQASGAKKKLVKSVVQATLAALAAGLAKGEELILHPLGKLRVNKTGARGDMMVKVKPTKSKPAKPAKPARQTLADGADND